MKVGDKILLHQAHIEEFSSLNTDYQVSVDEVYEIVGDADVEQLSVEATIEGEHKNFWIAKTDNPDYVDTPYLAIHKTNGGAIEAITYEEAVKKADESEGEFPNPDAITDIRKGWWFG